MIEIEVEGCVENEKSDKPERHFWPNLDEGRRTAKEKVENCSFKENHGKGEGYGGQVDFERIERMKGMNEGFEKRYFVCLECGYLYKVD